MAYDKFTTLTSTAVPLPIENVDTDQIIPARFLKATEREGFGDNLFRDWRYHQDNTPKEDFVLNDSTYSGLGDIRLRIPVCNLKLLCRYFQKQLLKYWSASGSGI
jgi:3-isopropylmalate dehydratase small subunit